MGSARCRKAAPQSESSECRCACHAPRHFGERAREGASRWQNIWVRGGGKGPMQWELEEAAPLCTEERRCCVSLLWMASDVTRSVARPKRLSERGVVATDRLPSARPNQRAAPLNACRIALHIAHPFRPGLVRGDAHTNPTARPQAEATRVPRILHPGAAIVWLCLRSSGARLWLSLGGCSTTWIATAIPP